MNERKCETDENTRDGDPRSTDYRVCPRDKAELNRVSLHRSVVDVCPICNGLLVQLDQSSIPELSSAAVKSATKSLRQVSDKKGASSPLTKESMRVFDYKGVEIDYCPVSNSVWLDAQELQKIRGQKKHRPVGENNLLGETRDTSWYFIDSGFGAAIGEVFIFVAEAISGLFDGQ